MNTSRVRLVIEDRPRLGMVMIRYGDDVVILDPNVPHAQFQIDNARAGVLIQRIYDDFAARKRSAR